MDPDTIWDGEWGRSRMGVLDGVVIIEGEGAGFGLNLGHPILTNGDFAMRLFPNYFGQDLFCIIICSNRRRGYCRYDNTTL